MPHLQNLRFFKMMNPVSRKTAVFLWYAFVGAAITAIALGYIAYFDLGLTQEKIRIVCLFGASLIGILIATEYFGKKLRKPK